MPVKTGRSPSRLELGRRFVTLPPQLSLPLGLLLLVVIGFIDYATGHELGLSLLYLLPVLTVTLLEGRLWGMVAAVAAAATWALAELAAGQEYSSRVFPVWNAAVRLGFFLICLYLFDRLRSSRREARESAELFRIATQNSAIGMAIVAPDGRFLEVNPALSRMLGREAASLRNWTWQEHTHADDLNSDLALLDDVLAGRVDSYRLRKRYVRADGVPLWGDLAVAAARDADGSLRYLIKQIVDVTDRVVAEERLLTATRSLAESERNFRIFFETIADIVIVAAKDGHIVFSNPAAAEKLGYSSAELSALHALDLYPPDVRPEVEAVVGDVVAGRRTTAEFPLQTKEGRVIEVETRIWFGSWNGRECIFGLHRDVSETRRAARLMRQRVAELASLQQIAMTLATGRDLLDGLPVVNARLALLFGAQDVLSVTFAEGVQGRHVFGRDEAESQRCEQEYLREGFHERELVERVDEWRSRPGSFSAGQGERELVVPLVVRGEVLGALLLRRSTHGRPFTAREVEVAETAAAAVAAAIGHERLLEQETLKAARDARDSVARELHDSVTQTVYSANLMAKALPAAWERDPSEALKATEELRNLTHMALAELRSLVYELRPAALAAADLSALVERLAEILAGRSGVSVDIQAEAVPDPPSDIKLALYRIVQEAFNNIAKHAAATRVSVHLAGDARGGISLEVHDDGRGFDPAAPRVGLGLGIMQERAREVGAQLEIDSEPARGTRLSLKLRPQQEQADAD
jgi:PAS domain S-box-containing protein